MQPIAQSEASRQRALALIRLYGWNNSSFQTLEPFFHYWFDDSEAGVVAYYRAAGTWVAAGPPICPADRVAACAENFVTAARAAGARACFFGTLARFVEALGPTACHLKIGEQPWWDPQRWSNHRHRRTAVGSQVRRARRQGVVVRQVAAGELADEHQPARRAASRVIDAWQQQHRMATMSFVVYVEPFDFADQRRYFLAELHHDSHPPVAVGFLASAPVYARQGWFLEDLMRTPDAPNGTAESLIDAAMHTAAAEGSHYATLGLCPLLRTDRSLLSQPRWASMVFSVSRRTLDPLFSFTGLANFKSKFHPDGWEEVYVSGVPRFTLRMLWAILVAFTRSQPIKFAARTGLQLVDRHLQTWSASTCSWLSLAFAATLVVWIALLANADSHYWFESSNMRDIWIAFDGAMVALFVLMAWGTRRQATWVGGLSLAMSGAAAADLFLTIGHALVFYQRHEMQLGSLLIWTAALGGPTLAAVFLILCSLATPHRQ